MKYYAGIGSRNTPENVLGWMNKIAKKLDAKGYILRSGGAKGADSAFESCAKSKEIFLANEYIPEWTSIFTEYFHPAPNKLSPYARKLMNRNAMQILGRNGDLPVEFVVCYTSDGKASGGTGQAMRIAMYYNIPIYNLYNKEDRDKLKGVMNE